MVSDAQPEQALHQGTLQLLTALKARYVRDTTAVQMPPDFLEDFALKWENEGLLRIVNDLSEALTMNCHRNSCVLIQHNSPEGLSHFIAVVSLLHLQ